ncbi:MAG: hypothetical protein LBR33_11780 [Propionibacteriaceae bacterium]|nr:hypothetical protein [Propionibacteriaceae bacterium]
MSADLFLALPDEAGFAADACGRFAARFGVELSFPEGLDLASQAGYLPCRVTGLAGAGGPVDAGFEMDRLPADQDGTAEFVLSVHTDDTALDWVVAHVVGAYAVAECGGQLEDPQDDTTYTRANLDALDRLIRSWLAEA